MIHAQDGGPAFPESVAIDESSSVVVRSGHEGLSLRDYFASAALATFADVEMIRAIVRTASLANEEVPEQIARHAYELADAMLAEREKNR